jgi:hypothetical protein
VLRSSFCNYCHQNPERPPQSVLQPQSAPRPSFPGTARMPETALTPASNRGRFSFGVRLSDCFRLRKRPATGRPSILTSSPHAETLIRGRRPFMNLPRPAVDEGAVAPRPFIPTALRRHTCAESCLSIQRHSLRDPGEVPLSLAEERLFLCVRRLRLGALARHLRGGIAINKYGETCGGSSFRARCPPSLGNMKSLPIARSIPARNFQEVMGRPPAWMQRGKLPTEIHCIV